MEDKFENFIRAFSHSGGCVRTCECGQTYYNSSGLWTWESGELESLEADPKAHDSDCTIVDVEFEGRNYVDQCECWRPRAEKIISFIDSHASGIADYLTAEKERKQLLADRSPVVI